jgi:type IV pilus assembly protein PilA
MLKRIREMKDQDGFTLIELMVVVLIIAILIAIAIPTFLGLRERAQNRSAQSNLRNGLTAAKAFYTDNETFGDGVGGVTDFDATSAELVEPSLEWAAAGSDTAVGIAVAAGDEVVLTHQSAGGDWYCAIDEDGASSVRGPGDLLAEVNTVALCGGLPVV